MRLPTWFPLAATLCLAGCATGGSEGFSALSARNPCLSISLMDYDRAYQRRVADEVRMASPEAAWPRLLEDYGLVRAELRACRRAGE